MSTVGPAPPPPLTAATTAPGPTAAVINMPPGLANLTAGMIITGTVIGRDAKGHAVIRTVNGTLTLASSLSLPAGSTLALQVQTMGAQVQVVVLSVNQQAAPPGAPGTAGGGPVPAGPAEAPAIPAAGPHGAEAPSLQRAPAPAITVTAGSLVTATVVGTPPGAGAITPPPPQGAPSANAAPAATSAAPAPGTVQPAPAQAGASPAAAATATTATATVPPQVGSRLVLSIVAIEPAGGADPAAMLAAAAASRPGASLIAGIVSAPSAAGQLQIQTPLGLLALDGAASLAPSSRVLLELMGPVQPPDTSAAPAQGRLPALALAREWATLTEAIAALGQVDASAARNLVENVVPRAGPSLAATILFLLSALRGGDVGGWLGAPAMRALEQAGRRDLAARLGKEFGQMGRLATDPATGEWRTWLVPFHDGNVVHLVRLFVKRHPRRDDSNGEQDAGTRFLVEADLSHLGPIQLDGLVKHRRFDLIMRSHEALPTHMRREISAIFGDALAITGFAGGLSFQAMASFAATPLNESGEHAVGLSV